MIDLAGISLTYHTEQMAVQALNNVNLSVHQGESCAIIGPSGCGKSSLLFILAGLINASSGSVRVSGNSLAGPRRQTALIIQDYGLLPWKDVWENIALGLKIRGVSKETQKSTMMPVIQYLGLTEFLTLYPAQLSGGLRQRVAIARALAIEPDLLLMDEPLSALDALTRESLQKTILDIWKEKQMTMVLVTHNIEEAVFLGRKIVIMSPRPGEILSIIKNPMAGDLLYRQHQEFYRQCTVIRQELDDHGNGAGERA